MDITPAPSISVTPPGIELVIGGIAVGSGYTATMAGVDRFGEPCSGTSSPFSVSPGEVSGAGITLTCSEWTADAMENPAPVMTGSVGLDAGIVLSDM